MSTININDANWSAFRDAVGSRENMKWDTVGVDPRTGFHLGRYQFGEALLSRVGYYCGDRTPYNDWRGRWKYRRGASDITAWRGNHNNCQDDAFDRAMQSLIDEMERLRANNPRLGNRSLTDFNGERVGGIVITPSGLLAAAWLAGAGQKSGDIIPISC